jgi:hypothetical protein
LSGVVAIVLGERHRHRRQQPFAVRRPAFDARKRFAIRLGDAPRFATAEVEQVDLVGLVVAAPGQERHRRSVG